MTAAASAADVLSVVELAVVPPDIPWAEEMLAALGFAAASYANVESGQAVVRVYVESPSAAAASAEAIHAALPAWAAGFHGRLPAPVVAALRREDWAESWKQYFHAFRASKRIVVKPSWEDYDPQAGDIVIHLDPGMCFGTGQHGTTRACLRFMDDLAARLGPVSFLDAGCGSGILSIGAAALGFAPLAAFDHDPQAVRTAAENLNAAGFTHVSLEVAELAAYMPARPARVVAANILADVLIAHRERLLSWVDASGDPGWLLLAGILHDQYPAVKAAFEDLGARQVDVCALDEWTSGCFLVPGSARDAAARPPAGNLLHGDHQGGGGCRSGSPR